MALIVQKFGGSSVKDRDRIFNVARIVANTHNAGNDVVVVENPEEIIIDQETTRDLQQKISDYLSPMENKVLDLYLKGEGYVEIGRILGKSPKSIDNALQRIRAKIREVISQNRK